MLVLSENPDLLQQVNTGLLPVYRIHHAATPAAARELLKGTGFDVVIAQHPLGDGSGLDLLTELAEHRHPGLRVLAAAVDEKKILTRAVNQARVSYILRQPWASDVLRDVTDSLLELRVRQRSRLQAHPTGDTTGSFKEGFTGVLPLAAFFRHLQVMLLNAGDATVSLVAGQVDQATADEADLTDVRLLSACVREATNTVPGALVARSGRRILALLPRCATGQATTLALHAQKNFARASAGSRISASFGVASFPDHATDAIALMDRVDEALQRAQQQGFGRVNSSLPRVVVVGPLQPLRHVIDALMRRDDIVLQVFEAASVTDLAREKPAVVLINAHAPRALMSELRSLGTTASRPRIIMAAMRENTPTLQARAGAVPGAVLVCERDRFTARVIEAVSGALGVKVRQAHRFASSAPVVIALGPETPLQRTHAAQLVNISDTGALLTVPEVVHPGEALRLDLRFGDAAASLPSTVVRVARSDPSWDVGVRFHELDAVAGELLARFIRHAGVAPPPPAAPRRQAPARERKQRLAPARFTRFTLRLSRVGLPQRWYLKVVNLAESGVLATSRVPQGLAEGDAVEAVLMDARGSVHCGAHVVRLSESTRGLWQVTLKFTEIGRRARAELGRMLAQCQAAFGAPASPAATGTAR